MEEHIVRIISIGQVTHDVKRFRFEKPEGYSFVPGQATEVSINSPDFRNEKRPFTFTCLTNDPFLEFTIKIYPSHNGFTKALGTLVPGDELIIREVWGAITYRGKGLFIAGGAGITPFISILRDLKTKNEVNGNILIFANKTRDDIILHDELSEMLGDAFVNVLSDEETEEYLYGFVTKEVIKPYITTPEMNVYLCGPPPMLEMIKLHLPEFGIEENSIILEL